MPPPIASTAEAVDLSAGAAILEDPGAAVAAAAAAAAASTRAGFLPDSRCLLIFIYSRLCSDHVGTIISTYWRWFRWCLFSSCLSHASSFHFLNCLWSTALPLFAL